MTSVGKQEDLILADERPQQNKELMGFVCEKEGESQGDKHRQENRQRIESAQEAESENEKLCLTSSKIEALRRRGRLFYGHGF